MGSMSISSDTYDVIVVGGGPAGASAAIHLAKRGASVLLTEQKKFPRPKLCGEFISPECLEHFQRLGVIGSMNGAGGAPLSETLFYARRGASVSVPSSWFGTTHHAVALGLSRAEMDERLLRRASAVGVLVLEDARATATLMNGDRVQGVRLKVGGQEGRSVYARVVLDATGRARALARDIEPHRRARSRRRAPLVAFKAHLEGALGNPLHCEIYFYRGGYGGLSSVEGGLSNLCFIASAGDVRALGGDPERVLRRIVMTNARASRTLREARPVTQWLGVALESFGRHEVVPAKGLLAVGDAASFIDPFTGSGMLMALESGELAAQSIADWLDAHGQQPESFDLLRNGYRARYVKRFDARLRICALLRRAAFLPGLAEAAILACGASTHLLRGLARATRRPPIKSLSGCGNSET